jgi:outer membrane lipoprotein-sorting protein
MSIFDRRPVLRWAVPAAVGAVILMGTLGGAVAASADSGLEPKTAEELLVALQAPQATSLSGTVVATADLGLPALPAGMGRSSDLTSLVSGSHTLRVWSDGPDRTRVALIGSAQESDVIRNGRDVWVWSSVGSTAEHVVLREHDASGEPAMGAGDLAAPSTPQEAAALVLRALDSTTQVTTSGVAKVAGRSVYELTLAPKQSDTLVSRAVIAMDAQTQVPLRVQVFSTQLPDPAYEVGFTSVDFSTPDASVFSFTPPPGVTVTEHATAEAGNAGAMRPTEAATMDKPTVVGTGWSQVLVGRIPADALTGGSADGSSGATSSAGTQALALLQALPRTSGSWGSGSVLNGTLFSVILTDDGRFAIGAVGTKALGAALAAG